MSASTAPVTAPAPEPDPTGTPLRAPDAAEYGTPPTVAKTRHPRRWVVSAVALILLAQFVHGLATKGGHRIANQPPIRPAEGALSR
jgi:polar amino acid transport system permease protein